MPAALIPDRALIDITGADASHFLQSLITTDVDDIGPGEAWPGALLTPQGKILFEFLIGRTTEGFVLETAADKADALLKRLMLYRLRAKVDLARRSDTPLAAVWNDGASDGLRDMRFAKSGIELWRMTSRSGSDLAAYLQLRIDNCISGAGEDGEMGEFFPHDLLMDRNGGLDFRKGCYVGQEVVSRMQHRSTARRRLVHVKSEQDLAPGSTLLTAGGKDIGTMIALKDRSGLAVVRLDKVASAQADGVPILLGEQAVSLSLPEWSGLDWPSAAEENAS